MKRLWRLIPAFTLAVTVCVAQDVVSIIHGTVRKVDKSTKTIVLKAADGTNTPSKSRIKPPSREPRKDSTA